MIGCARGCALLYPAWLSMASLRASEQKVQRMVRADAADTFSRRRTRLDPSTQTRQEDKKGRPVYVLVATALTREWQNVIKQETAWTRRYFTDETIADYPGLGCTV